jgi:hypothetical protein
MSRGKRVSKVLADRQAIGRVDARPARLRQRIVNFIDGPTGLRTDGTCAEGIRDAAQELLKQRISG